MNYRTLGRTGLKVSEIGLGSEAFVNKDDAFAQELISYAIDNGVNYFDLYNPEPYVRDFFGKAMKDCREKFIMQAHLCSAWVNGQYKRTRNIDEVKPAFADLLTRLNTDYIDVIKDFQKKNRELSGWRVCVTCCSSAFCLII